MARGVYHLSLKREPFCGCQRCHTILAQMRIGLTEITQHVSVTIIPRTGALQRFQSGPRLTIGQQGPTEAPLDQRIAWRQFGCLSIGGNCCNRALVLPLIFRLMDKDPF